MPQMMVPQSAYSRVHGNLPVAKVINGWFEATPTTQDGFSFQARKGLTSFAARGNGPINGLYSKRGVFADSLFSISDVRVYRNASNLGNMTGSGTSRWAASGAEIIVTRGAAPFSYNGTNLAAITMPSSENVVAVEYLAGRFYYVVKDTNQFFWSDQLDGRTVDSLNYANAELAPDNLVDVKAIVGRIYFIGSETIEPWYPSGVAELPVTREDQGLVEKGAIATGCSQVVNGVLVFIGSDCVVYRYGSALEPLSDEGINELIRASSTWSSFTYEEDGHTWFGIRLDQGTIQWSSKTGNWTELATNDRNNFRGQCATNIGPEVYFGDDETNKIWVFGDDFTDNDQPLAATFTALYPIGSGSIPFDVIEVRGNVGRTNPLTGDDANPMIEMALSRDAGNTLEDWREDSWGAQGQYRRHPVFTMCGWFDVPGAYAEFRLTDRSPRRMSGVFFNEPQGGRSR